jgi:3-methyladenine DNA glycosylase AlkC
VRLDDSSVMTSATRKGARHPTLVPQVVLRDLEAGAESANHMEQIALDMGNLLARQFPKLAARGDELRDIGLVARMRAGGRILFEELGTAPAGLDAACWSSDTTRGWAAMAVAHVPGLGIADRLGAMQPFADDPHFAVREWAWLSLRPHVLADLRGALDALEQWTGRESERLRRFASEVTRPRGVWSVHIAELKRNPALGLQVIEPLRGDASRYVQDSVGNWLNDAAKSEPRWVQATCDQWTATSASAATRRICRRGLRNVPRLLEAEAANLSLLTLDTCLPSFGSG